MRGHVRPESSVPAGTIVEAPGKFARPSRSCLSDLRAAFRGSTRLLEICPAHPAAPPLSASCSSGQHLCLRLLQIPPCAGHRCGSANTPPCRAGRGLLPPSHLPRHQNGFDSANHGTTRHTWRTPEKGRAFAHPSQFLLELNDNSGIETARVIAERNSLLDLLPVDCGLHGDNV